MRIFDQIDPASVDRREWQLWLLAFSVIIVLTVGMALLMYPTVFSDPIVLSGTLLRKSFFGFCGLSMLLVGYLLDRQIVIRQLRRSLVEEQTRNVRLRQEASVDLLESLPAFSHFQDRLAMEFRRAVNIQQPLSLLVVTLKPARRLTDSREICTAYGDAAKTLVRKLRGEDSIYLFAAGVFGIVLPGIAGADANRVADRLTEGLIDASGASNRFTSELRVINYPEHASSAREFEQMARASIPEDRRQPREAAVEAVVAQASEGGPER